MSDIELPDGLYDALVTGNLARSLASLSNPTHASKQPLTQDDATQRLSAALSHTLAEILDALPGDVHERIHKQTELVNAIIATLRKTVPSVNVNGHQVASPAQILKSIHRQQSEPPQSPRTGLNEAWL